ncbi:MULTISPECIES: hypothetical protein [Chryseobacterium group]|jgi:hypothetical protein|uniref:Uncharacterized protein n=4 Tax=Chryseobacterium TaxID=59732 RepID=A0AAJ1R6P6_9FLAO|nr:MULTISPECIES: hypothetical protein [Chryseobacterium group]EFK33197.1 hypothetical protein HMPREF0204_12265 [Chryseobacterium gleum ATCC 35910]MDN4013287.1 hypothetical protein [Chryseobacterium gambrini]MDN4028859.1 hypothetical protein [Chryseobacterium gambrini]MDO3425153.1 hypothetical protein [Chryseobacterium sp. APV1]QQY34004.1 hypothetical protein I6I60_09675 [Chryseobacterium gleum]
MGKVLMITGLLYILYYTGIAVYDLFIKKQIVNRNENDGELISLENFIEETPGEIINIYEDDVENLNLPSSYDYEETELSSEENGEPFNHRRFEEEREIENFYGDNQQGKDEKEVRQSFLSNLSSVIGSKNSEAIPHQKEIIPSVISDEMFRNFFEKASRHIVVGSESGQSFYKSSLVF